MALEIYTIVLKIVWSYTKFRQFCKRYGCFIFIFVLVDGSAKQGEIEFLYLLKDFPVRLLKNSQ